MAKINDNKKLIRAVGYLRKSTSGEDSSGRERQEKSIPQQKREIENLVKGQYQIVDWYDDPGVSGWKRGSQRPGFEQMINRAKERHDFQAIVCDALDRFSRANYDEVQEDALALKRAGVRWIVTAAQGTFDLGRSGNDIGEIMKFVVPVWSAHEYSRQLGRRIALARRNRALEGKRSGGVAPFGMAMVDADGKPVEKGKTKGCNLIWGDPKEIKVIRQIFDWFVNKRKSMNWIAGELNRRGTPTRHGKKWFTNGVKDVLQQRAYRGDFVFGKDKSGQFFVVNSDQQVVAAEEARKSPLPNDQSLFLKKEAYKPLIDPKLFDTAQKRIAGFSGKGGRRPRENGYPLSGVLICDHCHKPLYGVQPTDRRIKGTQLPKRVYRCSTNTGSGTCGNYFIDEDNILPFVLQTLGEEIDNLSMEKLMMAGRQEHLGRGLSQSEKAKRDKIKEYEKKIADIKCKIDRAAENLMSAEDARTRSIVDAKIKELWTEHDHMEAKLETMQSDNGDSHLEQEEIEKLNQWWLEFLKKSVRIPLDPSEPGSVTHFNTAAYLKAMGDDRPFGIDCDSQAVNEALHSLGCRVRLRWTTSKVTLKNGKQQNRYSFDRGRLQLGQKTRDVIVHKARLA